jgi:hypothetical protein
MNQLIWPPNFLPQHFTPQSIRTERKKRQKQRKWWVGKKIDLKQSGGNFLSVNTFLPKWEYNVYVYQSYISLKLKVHKCTSSLCWNQFLQPTRSKCRTEAVPWVWYQIVSRNAVPYGSLFSLMLLLLLKISSIGHLCHWFFHSVIIA